MCRNKPSGFPVAYLHEWADFSQIIFCLTNDFFYGYALLKYIDFQFKHDEEQVSGTI
jgi:hypothetical protein